MKKLYHGTKKEYGINIIKNGIDLSKGRVEADFGRGFYMTPNLGLARKWAERNNNVFEKNNGMVLIFEADMNGLSKKEFSSPDNDWLLEILSNRLFKKELAKSFVSPYDYMVGPIADGRRIENFLESFRNEQLTNSDIQKLYGFFFPFNYSVENIQYAFKTEKAIHQIKYLDFDKGGK